MQAGSMIVLHLCMGYSDQVLFIVVRGHTAVSIHFVVLCKGFGLILIKHLLLYDYWGDTERVVAEQTTISQLMS